MAESASGQDCRRIASAAETARLRLWDWFRGSALWRGLRGVALLREGRYLSSELLRSLCEKRSSAQPAVDRPFRSGVDPWAYLTSALEAERLNRQTEILDRVRASSLFRSALEVGCAEGAYTTALSPRCDAVLALDLSPTALARARQRLSGRGNVQFQERDLRGEALRDSFDLIVAAGVLEYFRRRSTFRHVRANLVDALTPGGYLLVESTRAHPLTEKSWWGRYLIRGKWINAFMAEHRELVVVENVTSDWYVITLFQRQCPRT